MNRHLSIKSFTKLNGHFIKSFVLIGEEGVATGGGDGDCSQAGALRRILLEAPVAMPRFGEDGASLIDVAADRRNVIPTGDRTKEGVLAKGAEVEGETFKVVIINELVGKNQDMMLKPGGSKLGDLLFGEASREVDSRDFGSAGLG